MRDSYGGRRMLKKDVVNALQKASETQGFITIEQLKAAFGVASRNTVKKYVRDLPVIGGKYYLITDVAAEILKHVA